MESSQSFERKQVAINIGLTGALTASLGIHLLVSWWLASSMDLTASMDKNRTSEKTLRLKLQWIEPATSDPAPPSDIPHPTPVDPHSVKPEARLPKKPHPKSRTNVPTNKTTPQHHPSAQVLLRSAEQVAREMGRTVTDASERISLPDHKSVSARLNRALNPKQESAGVSVRADGTTRVVTDWGYTYCIKPLDEGQIADPGEDLRVSMICR